MATHRHSHVNLVSGQPLLRSLCRTDGSDLSSQKAGTVFISIFYYLPTPKAFKMPCLKLAVMFSRDKCWAACKQPACRC